MTALTSNLTATVTVADPDVVGPLAVFPLIAAQPRSLRYQAFAQGGVTVHELEEAQRQRPAREQRARRARPALRGRGGAGRAAEPHVRRVGARARGRGAAGAGELRRGAALGRRPSRGGVHARAADRVPGAPARQERADAWAARGRGGGTRRPGRGLVDGGREGPAPRRRLAHGRAARRVRRSPRRARGAVRPDRRAARPGRHARGDRGSLHRASTTSAIPTRSPRSTPRSCRATRWTRSRRRRRTRRPPTPPVSSCTR